MSNRDRTTLEGRGGLYNGESYSLDPGQSATAGSSTIASFPVTLCANYRRLTANGAPPASLDRLAPEHVRFVYVGEGRLHVENLAGRDLLVGGREIEETLEVDLREGSVEIEFGYGERLIASIPDAPETLQALGNGRNGTDETRRAFLALLRRDWTPPETVDLDPPLSLYPEEPAPAVEREAAAAPQPTSTGKPEAAPPEVEEEPKRKRRSAASAIFLSGLVHLVLLLGLFSWISSTLVPDTDSVAEVTVVAPRTWSTPPEPSPPVGDPVEPDTPLPAAPAELEESELAESGPEAESSESGAELPGPAGPVAGGILGIGGAGGGAPGSGGTFRPGGGSGGGGSGTGPVALGLDWLARHQRKDGAWGSISSLSSCTVYSDQGRREYRVAMTGLALLAFVGAGNTQREGAYSEQVMAAARWLLRREGADGSFHTRATPAEYRPMYGQAMAVLALGELLRVSRSPILKKPVERGLRFIERTQNVYAGWRYTPGDETSDTSVTGWQVLAYVAAKRAGVPANPVLIHGVLTWLDEMTDPVTYRVGYRRRGRGSPGMTATGLATRLLFGAPRTRAEVRGAREVLLRTLPTAVAAGKPGATSNPPDLLYWYFGAIATRRLGGNAWRYWQDALRTALEPRQELVGEAAGSFAPMFEWDRIGGRVMSTALAILCLELVMEYEEAFR